MSLLKKADQAKAIAREPRVLTDRTFAKDCPILWNYLTQTAWEDGSPRVTSTVTVFADDGILKIVLKDRDAGVCLWAAGASFWGTITALEAALGDEKADWRQDRNHGQQPAKRVKRA